MRTATDGITGSAADCMAVSANCENVQNAYNFVKLMISEDFHEYALEQKPNMKWSMGRLLSINNNVVHSLMNDRLQETADSLEYIRLRDSGELDDLDDSEEDSDKHIETEIFDGRNVYPIGAVPDKIIEQILGMGEEIDNINFDPKLFYDLRKTMQLFLDDKATYEECTANIQNMLEIYMTE